MDHLRKRDLQAFLGSRPARASRRRVVRHLIAGCPDCGARVFHSAVAEEDAVYDACIDRASVIVCTIPDDLLKGTSNLKLVRMLRNMGSKAKIIVNAIEFEEAAQL